MSKLKEYKLNELYEMGSGISTKPEQAGHGSPFVSFSSIYSNEILPDELPDLMDTSKEEQEKYSVKKGDILLTRTSEKLNELAMSSVAIKDYPNATFSGFAKRLRPLQTDITYDKFMAYFMRSDYFRKVINCKAVMTLRASFNEEIFSYIKILLPDYNQQVKSGDLFWVIEQKIRNNNKINAELESMAKTIYDYWFLQFEFPNEEGKPYKSSGGKMVWNEELKREIPEGWEVLKVSDITNVVTGKEDANFAVENGAYKFFTCSQDILLCDEYSFEGSAVLIAGNGDFNVKHYTGKFNAYQRTYVLIPKEKEFYGCLYIAAKEKIDYFKAGANGSIVKFITKGDVKQITMLKPRNDNLFDTINKLIEKIEIIQKENEELTSLRDFLLPLLMNGQVGFKE